MKPTSYLSGAVMLVLLTATAAAGQAVPGAPRTDWEQDRRHYTIELLKSYNDFIAQWRTAWERGDAKATSGFYSDTATLVVTQNQPIRGRRAIEAFLREDRSKVSEIRMGLSDFVASDRITYAMGPFWLRKAAGGAASAEETLAGTCVTVLVREGNRWKIRSQIFAVAPNHTSSE